MYSSYLKSGLDHISLSILLELNNTITHEEALCITSAVLHTMRFPTGLTLPSPNNPSHPPYMICSFQIWLIACLLRLSLMPQISRHTRQFPYLARAARPQEQMNEERAVMWGSFVCFFSRWHHIRRVVKRGILPFHHIRRSIWGQMGSRLTQAARLQQQGN